MVENNPRLDIYNGIIRNCEILTEDTCKLRMIHHFYGNDGDSTALSNRDVLRQACTLVESYYLIIMSCCVLLRTSSDDMCESDTVEQMRVSIKDIFDTLSQISTVVEYGLNGRAFVTLLTRIRARVADVLINIDLARAEM